MRRVIVIFVWIQLILVLFNAVGGQRQRICTKGCSCNPPLVQCVNQSLITFPQFPPNTTIINLRFNKIKVIPPNVFMGSYQLEKLILSTNEINVLQPDSFSRLTALRHLNLNFNQIITIPKETLNDLIHLEDLHMEHNLIRDIEPFAFSRLKRLRILNLRDNHLNGVPSKLFQGLGQLQKLYLSQNKIDYIAEDAFSELTSLKGLYLKSNRIRKISPRTFNGLHHLEDLYLDNNNIREIDLQTFSSLHKLQKLFLSGNKITTLQAGLFDKLINIKELRLENNPIICDCGVASLLKSGSKASESASFACEGPPMLRNRQFSTLRDEDFDCGKTHVGEEPYDMTMFAGETAELPCTIATDPDGKITWMHNAHKVHESKRMKIASSGNLLISPIESNDVGIYECMSQTVSGQTKSLPIKMVVNARENSLQEDEEPHFDSAPKSTVIPLDGVAVFDCVASGMPPPDVKWFFKNREILEPTATMRILSNGSLEVFSASLKEEGVYKCEASNRLKSIQAEAKLEIKELPVFIRTPESLTLKKGQILVLECDAEGNPLPTIAWTFNGQTIVANKRISLESENTELIIEDTKYSDSGKYKCIATNENGESESEAIISIEDIQGPPKIISGPYDIVAISGTTIEIPCKGDDESVQVQWQKDGSLIQNVGRFQISNFGSLYIKNSTLSDTGRYECSIKNEHGRATESGLVTIRSNEALAPGDRYVRVAFTEASREIDLAINNTVAMLFTNRTQSNPLHHSELLRLFRFPKGEARQLARAAEIYERTMVNIRKHVQEGRNLAVEGNQYEYNDLLSREHLRLVAELSGCMEYREMPNCTDMCFHSRYRTIDGTCNNLNNPTLGASLTAFRRIEKPIYENGFSMPIGWMKGKLYSGFPKPSSRLVSTTLISTKEITADKRLTHMVMQWGQFLDHDLDHAIPSVSSESWDGVDCKKTCEFAPPCYPIEVPPNDPRVKNRRCIDLIRSSAICGSGMTSVFFDSVQQREQINQLTSYIDASQVYGYTIEFAEELRNQTTEDGLLRTGVHFPNQREMLPFTAPQYGVDCRRNLDENSMNCFVAGDIRANEQVGLLAMHTIWMREHNRIAIKLRDINPHWDGDTIYQEARKIVGAQMQHITYKHWLPLIIGPSGMEKLGEYKGYDPSINPSIANEFATAAFRFGHTLINPILHRLNKTYQPIPQGHLPLHKAFFAPWRLAYEGGVDPLMRGFFTVPAKMKKPDQNLNTELTEKLFLTSHAVALDLAAMNIQRGRDHGIPGYNLYRKFCNLSVANTFDDLANEISSAEIRQKLKELYGHPDNIDLFVGGILEDPVEEGKIGPLFQCILVDQFRKLRDGDRFYYENPSVFLPDQLQQIKQANLGRVLCDSADDITEVTANVFLLPSEQGGYTNCLDIQGINLYFWQDCGTCDSVPALLKTYVPDTYPKRNKRSVSHSPHNFDSDEYTEFAQYKRDTAAKINNLEETISDFQKTFQELHEKLESMEQTCASGRERN